MVWYCLGIRSDFLQALGVFIGFISIFLLLLGWDRVRKSERKIILLYTILLMTQFIALAVYSMFLQRYHVVQLGLLFGICFLYSLLIPLPLIAAAIYIFCRKHSRAVNLLVISSCVSSVVQALPAWGPFMCPP